MSFALFIVYILATYLRPFEMFAPQLNVFRPMLILLALALVASTARALARGDLGARPVHFGLLAFLVAAIGVSQVANQWAGGALVAIGDFSASALLMVLCFLNLNSLKRVQATCIAIACSVVFLAVVGIYSFHTGYKADELVLRQNPADKEAMAEAGPVEEGVVPAQDDSGRYFYRLRSMGFLNDPNDFAQVMVMVLPLLWWAHRPGRWGRTLLVVAAPAAVLGYAIYLTQSRGALLGVGMLMLLASYRILGAIKTGFLVALAVIAMGAISFGGRELSSGEESAADRVDAWFAGWTMLKSHPLFGVGYGNFLDHHHLTAHNSFVLCFSELGLFGYFPWLGMIVLTFLGLNRAVSLTPQGSPEWRAASMLRAALVGYLACAWFLSRTYQPGLYVVLALGIAAWVAASKVIDAGAGATPAAKSLVLAWSRPTIVAMFGSIAVIYVFIYAQRFVG